MASKKKLDEKHLKMLREMVAMAHNKQCIDCHQRGPTYVNMTIGSYVCTACSGLLRGLNPPHRVKSISMASFTQDEMEFIKCHGNEYCRKVWLGLYDTRQSSQTESRDEAKVKDFMAQKYERKRYYVAPTENMKEEAKRMNESAITTKTGTKSLKSLLGDNVPKLQIGNTQVKAPVSATPPPIGSNPQSPGNQSLQSSKSSGSTAMDLLGELGGDPFASSAPQTHTPGGGGFADFGNFGNTATSTQQAPSFQHGAPLQPAGSTSQSSQQSFNGFISAPAPIAPPGGGSKYSDLTDLFSVPATTEESTPAGWGTTPSTTSAGVSWRGAPSGTNPPGAINWGGDVNSTSSGGMNWNSSSTQPAPSSSGLNWGGGGGSATTSSWGGAAVTAQSNGLGTPGNPFLSASVANPFGGGNNTVLTTQSSAGVVQAPNANPFGGQQGANAGFGAFGAQNVAVSQNAGFGQFGTPASTAGAGFAQFGNTAGNSGNPGAGFGQQFASVQNGGFGANTPATGFGGPQAQASAGFGAQPGFGTGQAGFGGQTQQHAGFGAGFGGQPGQGFPQQQQAGFGSQPTQMQGFGGAPVGGSWGQVPGASVTVNPFMSTAQQYSATPKTGGATNPFL